MTVIKINALTVPADSGDELAHRFARRAGSVDGQPGFEGFELLKPVDGRHQWLVVTRWADEESYQAWFSSAAFGRGHGRPSGAGHGAGHGAEESSAPAPVSVASELWSYEVAVSSAPPHA